MMPMVAIAAAAAAQEDKKDVVHDFVYNHVLFHMAEADVWNLPFVNIPLLDVFRYDGVMMAVGALVLVILCGLTQKPDRPVPHGWANVVEVFVLFIRDQIARPFLGEADGRKYTPLLCSFFFFILALNLLGLFPLFGTATGNINVTGALACVTFGFMVFGSVHRRGFFGFLKCFAPEGLPKPLLLFMAPLEFISMLSKVLALMIRLFANMLAGHIIIFSLVGLVGMFGVWAAPVLALVVGVYFFEIFIAFFQAYIFTLLSAIYMGQLYNPEEEG